jgi:hypothetical protein
MAEQPPSMSLDVQGTSAEAIDGARYDAAWDSEPSAPSAEWRIEGRVQGTE